MTSVTISKFIILMEKELQNFKGIFPSLEVFRLMHGIIVHLAAWTSKMIYLMMMIMMFRFNDLLTHEGNLPQNSIY